MPSIMEWSEPLVSLSDTNLEGMVSMLESRAAYRTEGTSVDWSVVLTGTT